MDGRLRDFIFCPMHMHSIGQTIKKALDYASDYQLESACKDAPCIALSRVTEKIFLLF